MAGISFEEAAGAQSTTPSKGISFEEATGAPTAPVTSASAPVEGKGGAAFGMYAKPGMKPNEQVSRAATNIGRSALEAAPGSLAGLAGFGGGMEIGTAMGVITSPVLTPAAIPVLGFAGGLLGAFGSSAAVTAVSDKIHKTLFPEDWTARQQEKQANPYETFAGETLANLMGMSPKTMAAPVTQGMSKLGRLASTDIGQRTVSAGLQTGIEAGSEFVREGKVDPVKLGVSAATGAAMPGFNVLGKKVFGAGESVGKAVTDKMFKGKPTTTETADQTTTKPASYEELLINLPKDIKKQDRYDLENWTSQAVNPSKSTLGPDWIAGQKKNLDKKLGEGFTDKILAGEFKGEITKPPSEEESKKAGFVKKVAEDVATEKAAADAKIPLVQTAIRNKDTGEIELLGPKHSEARKSETKDTHEQGFVDESGTFLNRKDAWNRAKSAGQVPEGQSPEYPKEGLHSGDLRKAGDDRFKLANVPKEANGVPIEEGTTAKVRADGRPIGATFRKKDGKIIIDTPTLYEQYGEKPWTKPKVEGVYPIAENAFPTFQDYVDFIVAHEAEHTVTPQTEGQTKAQYENQTNQTALKQLAEKKASAASVETDPKAKQFAELIRKVSAAEKYSRPEDWTPQERAAWDRSWEEFSRVRGYSEQEIADYKKYMELAKEMRSKYGDDVVHEFDMLITKGEHPDFPDIKGSVDVGDRIKPVDRTTTDPRNVKNEEELYDIAKEIYAKHGEVETVKFYEGYREYQKTWKEPIKETEKAVGINIRNKEANERVIHNEREEMLKSVSDPARREAVAEAVDKGDLSGLSPEETALAKKYEALVKDIGNRAVEQGVVKGLLEDYVTHILDWAGAPKGAREEFINSLLGTSSTDPTMRGMTTTSKFAKERKFKTFADLQVFIDEANARIAAAGKSDFRLKIKTKDIAEIYKEYALSMEKAIENKKLVDTLKQIRNVAGETLIKEVDTKDNPMPVGWKMMDSPQFSGYAVHPDMEPALKFVFDAGPGDLMKALGAVSQLTKRLNVIGSFFHAKSLMEVISSSGIPIWSPVKEAIVLPLVEKGVKAVTGKDIQLSAISKAVEQFKNGGLGDNVDTWIRQDGLKLEMPEDVSQGLLTSVGKYADSLIAKFGPKTRALESTMSTVEKYTLGLFDKYTWDYLHTGGKIMVADAYLDKARRQAAEQGKPFDEVASRKEIASFVNDSFGGLNWFEAATSAQTEMGKRMAMAAYSPEGRRSLQLVLFAPDWTISTVRAFTAALPKGLNPTKWHPVEGVKGMMTPTTKADYARLYQFKTALTYLTLINGINMITANRPVWENKDPTRIEFPDGTSMQAMKHAMEPYHWIMDPDKTLANKLGFLPKAAIIGIGGLEYGSPNAPKLVDRSATNRLLTVAKSAAPFQFQAAANAPEGEGAKRALLGTMGFPIYGSSPEQRKLANAERELATKEQAWKYRDKEIKAGRIPWTAKHDRDKQTLDKRRQKLNEQTGKE
jgi:hypothetical protein